VAQLRHLRQQFPDELVIISVHSGKFPAEKSTDNIRQAVMRHGIDHPVVNDANFEVWQQYAVRAWPTLALINPEGKIVHTQSGEILAGEFSPLIEALIAEFEKKGLLDRASLDLRPERTAEPMRPLHYPSRLLLAKAETSSERYLFIADTGHHRILQVRLAGDGQNGEIMRLFGTGQLGLKDGPGEAAMFHDPHGMALRGSTLYVADTENHAIRAIDLEQNRVRTVAGTGQKAHGRFDLGRPTEIPLRSPWALWAEENILLIGMAGSHQIWLLVNEERLGLFAGNGREALVDGPVAEASFNQPSDLFLGFGHLFVADSEASAIRAVSLLGQEPQVITLIGQGLFEFGDIDGTGGMVRLQHPTGLTFYEGLVYIADSYNHKIKTLDPTTGQVKTLIGTGQPGHADGPFTQAELFEPEGVVAGAGRLYIADTNNHLIRVADLDGQRVQTLMLRGLEKLAARVAPEKEESRRLDPVTVGVGEVEVRLNIDLPEGYKLNAEAPQLLQLQINGITTTHTFKATERPHFKVYVDRDSDLNLNVTLYYCEAEEQRLCMIHEARLILPLIVKDSAEGSIQVGYKASL
jgi:DNA-binding beta-propeller fold protein YncE